MTAPLPRILFMEDEAAIRDIYASSFGEKYRVEFACNGLEGFRQAMTTPPDLLVTDLKMPEMSGAESVVAMEFMDLRVPTIVVSGYLHDLTYQELLSSLDFVVASVEKPVDLVELGKLIQDTLDKTGKFS